MNDLTATNTVKSSVQSQLEMDQGREKATQEAFAGITRTEEDAQKHWKDFEMVP